MTQMQKKFATACLATAIAGAGITIAEANAHATPSRPVAAHVEKTHRAAPAKDVDADASRYATREAGAKQQQEYQGGAMLIVGISATAAIVALVLLLLLL